jgi:1,4-alpha-glucan branching enzyme
VAAFGRDPESSKQVWSSREGYPGDPDYREFYRDIGFDLDFSYIQRYIHKDGIRVNTGIKYHRVTGHTPQKEPYVRARALDKAALHAADFIAQRRKRVDLLGGQLGRPPLLTATYDAELFGHWWFEGPDWLDFLFRKIAAERDTLRWITPPEYLAEHPSNQVEMPGASSWGDQGYNQVWLNGTNDWVYRHLHAAADRMVELADRFPRAHGNEKRALNQAARELLLAQASDWAFIMKSGTTVPYAVRRTKRHLLDFAELYAGLKNGGGILPATLARMESRNNIFPKIDYRVFATEGATS